MKTFAPVTRNRNHRQRKVPRLQCQRRGPTPKSTACQQLTRAYLFIKFQPGRKSFVIYVLEAKVPHFTKADRLNHLWETEGGVNQSAESRDSSTIGPGSRGSGAPGSQARAARSRWASLSCSLQELVTNTGHVPKAANDLFLLSTSTDSRLT